MQGKITSIVAENLEMIESIAHPFIHSLFKVKIDSILIHQLVFPCELQS